MNPWQSRCISLLAALSALMLGACDTPDDGAPSIPPDHPCPAWALAPVDVSEWAAERDGGAPVPLALALPFEAGVIAKVSQGTDQPPTHEGTLAWAVDFAVPVDTLIVAAAPGVVVLVRDDSDRHGVDASFVNDANWLVVDHGGGLFTSYVHLATDSAVVRAGDHVAAGEPLARTGLSGQLAGPHTRPPPPYLSLPL